MLQRISYLQFVVKVIECLEIDLGNARKWINMKRLQKICGWLRILRGSTRGQAAVEYIVVVGTLIAAISILVVFLIAFREYGERVLELAAYEYP